jgi:DNA-binding transcriptional LysR family regulator
MAIDQKLLIAFRDVMETQSMTGAARLAGVTQPAISAQIARLEDTVRFELFERVGGRLKASDRGRQFYEEVRTALDSLERLEKVANGIRSGKSDEVTVASHPSASISILPDVIARLRTLQPDSQIRMINRTSERVRAVFEAGGADIGIAEGPINVMPGVTLKRFRIDCCAILP